MSGDWILLALVCAKCDREYPDPPKECGARVEGGGSCVVLACPRCGADLAIGDDAPESKEER